MAILDIPGTNWCQESYLEDAGGGCSGMLVGTTIAIADAHNISPFSLQNIGYIQFDTSTIPALVTINSANIHVYGLRPTASKGLTYTENVQYRYKKGSLSTPPVCADSSGHTTFATKNFLKTTGWKIQVIASANLDLAGDTVIKLYPSWSHLNSGEYARRNICSPTYAVTANRPFLRIDYTPASTGGPPQRTLTGVGL